MENKNEKFLTILLGSKLNDIEIIEAKNDLYFRFLESKDKELIDIEICIPECLKKTTLEKLLFMQGENVTHDCAPIGIHLRAWYTDESKIFERAD